MLPGVLPINTDPFKSGVPFPVKSKAFSKTIRPLNVKLPATLKAPSYSNSPPERITSIPYPSGIPPVSFA